MKRSLEVSLLDARHEAIQKCVEACGGDNAEEIEAGPVRTMMVMLAREASGIGFDAGVKYMAERAGGQTELQKEQNSENSAILSKP